MTLNEWRNSENLKPKEAARLLGVSLRHYYRLERGERKPRSEDDMQQIYRATGGQVTANDFFGLPSASEDDLGAAA